MSIQPIPWHRAWAGILRYPSVTNFEILLLNPNAKRRTAYNWMAVVGIGLSIISFLPVALTLQQLTGGPQRNVLIVTGVVVLCSLPLNAVASIFGLVFAVTIQNSSAQLLGGKGTFDQLVYAEATFAAPLFLVSSTLSVLPYLNLLTVPVAIYSCILSVMAIKAVHQFGWTKAIVSSLAVFVFIAIISIVLLAFLTSRGIPLSLPVPAATP